MSVTQPDLFDHLTDDTMRNPSSERIKSERLRAIQTVSDRDGDFDANRVRVECAPWARKTNRAGAVTNGLVQSGAAVPTGRYGPLGNTEHRAGNRPTPVYRLTRRVWPVERAS